MRSAFTIVACVNRSVHPRLRYYLIPYPIITSSLHNGWLVGSGSRQKGDSRRQKSALWLREFWQPKLVLGGPFFGVGGPLLATKSGPGGHFLLGPHLA